MSARPLMGLFIVVVASLPNFAHAQPAPTDPPFDERWNVPSTSAVPWTPSQLIVAPGAQPFSGPESGPPSPSARAARKFSGKASFYAYTRGKTASGAPHNPHGLTAAHRTLPFGTRLRVTDPKTNRTVEVVVNDRGPAIKKRVIDLSLGAAEVLGMIDRGLASVNVEVISSAN
jgi:3D (Asp-Asp-Asp) domain-containing protein